MKRKGPEEEACGVWLDAAALKRRRVQTHLIKPGTKMLTLLPQERKPSISFTQRRITPASIRQTSIVSFFTLHSGMTNAGKQISVSSHIESQIKESKKDATQLDCLFRSSGDGCVVPPLATSTPADNQDTGLAPQPLRTSGHYSLETPIVTLLSLPESNTLVCAGESKASPVFSFTQDLESSCFLDQKDSKKDFSRKRDWPYGSEKNCKSMERHMKSPRGKCHQLLDKAVPGCKVSGKSEYRQPPAYLQTSKESCNRENTEPQKERPCPISVVSWDNGKNNRDSWSQLFTEDSQGQRVIAHNTRVPFQDVSNVGHQGLGRFPSSPQAQCQAERSLLNVQPDLLFTQDSEGNQVIRHQF
ncbi:aurora kinase A- and ninein-interacting protein [Ctenodactylus gundi]